MPPDPALPEDGQAATQPGPVGDVHRDEHGHERIPLTRNETRRLLTSLHCQPRPIRHQLHRPRWRRRHQATARKCHCHRRNAPSPDHEVTLK
jgi:hypothetical protein